MAADYWPLIKVIEKDKHGGAVATGKFLRQTWAQVTLVYLATFLLMWIGLRHTSSSDLATTILWVGAILVSSAYAAYTFSRTGKMSTCPKWWLDFATDKKYKSKIDSKKLHDPLCKPKDGGM